jgi:hypothetical protein
MHPPAITVQSSTATLNSAILRWHGAVGFDRVNADDASRTMADKTLPITPREPFHAASGIGLHSFYLTTATTQIAISP